MEPIDLAGRETRPRARRAPSEPLQIVLPFASDGALPDDDALTPVELTIEATNAERDLAAWCDDDWWTEVIIRWADRPVTIRLSPTPGALLHPVLLYQLEMLRRVTPNWRLIGYGYRDDVTGDADVEALARSWYHEIRFIDQPRPGLKASDRFGDHVRLDDLFGRIRRAQAECGMTTPILVRLPSVRIVGASGPARSPDGAVMTSVAVAATPRP